MLLRFVVSVFVIAMAGIANALYSPVATLATGQAAGRQLLPSDGEYLRTMYTFSAFSSGFVIITAIALLLLMAIWARPVADMIRKLGDTSLSIIVLAGVASGMIFLPVPAKAYYDQKDFTEAYSIGPNETAIVVPDIGDNKNTQVQMDSEAYLKSAQVPHKRVIIPHAKLSGSGSWYDYYVPSARLFIVDRTTYSHEWVGKGRGTNPTVDESIPCQSKEGLDVTFGIVIGTRVKEEDAARFLYNFGTQPLDPKTNRSDPQVVFQSVYYSRKVADVMNDIGRKAVMSFVCEEATSRSFDNVNSQLSDIVVNVRKKATEYFTSVGITVQFLGLGDTVAFASSVQKAIDDRYIVDKLGSSLSVLNAIANLKVQEGLGAGLDKHGLPIVVTPDMLNILSGLAAKAPAAVVSPSQVPAAK